MQIEATKRYRIFAGGQFQNVSIVKLETYTALVKPDNGQQFWTPTAKLMPLAPEKGGTA